MIRSDLTGLMDSIWPVWSVWSHSDQNKSHLNLLSKLSWANRFNRILKPRWMVPEWTRGDSNDNNQSKPKTRTICSLRLKKGKKKIYIFKFEIYESHDEKFQFFSLSYLKFLIYRFYRWRLLYQRAPSIREVFSFPIKEGLAPLATALLIETVLLLDGTWRHRKVFSVLIERRFY